MWTRSLCLSAAAWFILAFGLGCEEQAVEKKPAPVAEKAEPKAAQPKPEVKPETKPETRPEVKPEAKAPEKPAAPAQAPEPPKPAPKTEVTVAKVTPPEAPKPPAPPAPPQAPPAPAEPEKKVAPPKPPVPPPIGPYKGGDSVWVVDDFELGNNTWQVEAWANPATLSIADGALKVVLGEGKQDKSAIGRAASLDLSDRGRFTLDVRNGAAKDVKVAVAFMTGGGSTYFETEPAAAKPGVNKGVTFDLKSEKFKSAASNWEHKAKLLDANAVKRVCILIYGENKAEVALDNIKIEK